MQETAETAGPVDSTMNGVYLVQAVCVSPGQSKVVEVKAISDTDDIGVITTTEDMGSVMCDFQEILRSGSNQFRIILNNWETEPLTLAEGQQVDQLSQLT